MADSVELRMSVASIKRVDPYVKDVLASSTQVALYIFNTSKNEWEKTDTEGALFIYRRNGEPFHSIMIVNRRNTDNVIEPIVKEFDYQMQIPFLLYRNSKNKIFGIWFFNRDECIRITFLLESLMEGLKGKTDQKSTRGNNVDIFTMLSKAQEDYNKTPSKQEGPPTFSSTPRVLDVTSQSVMDFFAKASTKSTKKPNVAGESNEHVLQRLMSNPAHSVEHIEKQQRSITPLDQVKQQQKIVNTDRRSVPISFPGTSTGDKHSQPENNISLITQPKQDNSPLSFLLQSQAQPQSQSQSEREGTSEHLVTSSFAQFLDSSQKPHLMTPMMFTAPKSKEKLNATPNCSFTGENQERINLLNEKQLAQALIHLLKNDTEFTKQIHNAYVESIMQKVNLNSNP